jgi:hypothetical protein
MGQRQSQPAAEANSATSTNSTAPELPATKVEIDARVQPALDDARSHNFGQPIQPSNAENASKLKTDCRAEQRASLRCIEENYENKDVACAQFFEDYKQCRRNEHERKLARNAKMF